MAQPVRKKIQEEHGELISEQPIYTLLVDGNSLLFFSFKDEKVNIDNMHYGGIFQFMLQLKNMIVKHDFDYVYVFFDDTYSGYERWCINPYYKQNRDKHYEDYGVSDYMKQYNESLKNMQNYLFNKQKKKEAKNAENRVKTKSDAYKDFVDANFDRERDVLCNYFNELFIRWNIDEITEGDDQIAYYCLNKKPNEKIIIMSGDMDLSQLLADDIAIYNLHLKKFITNKNFKEYFGYSYENVMVKKVFTGDASDNIPNIKGLSEDGLYKLMPEIKDRKVTIEEVKERAQQMIDERKKEKKKPLQLHENIINGVSNKPYDGDFYEINRKIIDLSHPLLSKEAKETMDSMMYNVMDPEGRSFGNLYRMILADNITEWMGDTKFASFFNLFKRLEIKERKRFEEFQKNQKK